MNAKKDIEPKRTFDDYVELGTSKANLFGHNFSALQAFKRTERIVAALYLLTNNVPYAEPIRQKIRSNGHELIHKTLELKSGFGSNNNMAVAEVGMKIRELLSLSRMLYAGGYISRANAEIITKALDDLALFVLTAGNSSVSEETVLSSADFAPIRSEKRATKEPSNTLVSVSDSGSKGATVAQKSARKSARGISREDRRKLILDTLQGGGKLGIKDISLQVVGYSEKTVQRELTALVNEGIVRKEGEKRWSTYSLV